MSGEKTEEVGEKSPLLAAAGEQGGLIGAGLADAATQKALGKQTITSWGSFILNCNNLIGPALVTFPLVYQTGTKRRRHFLSAPEKRLSSVAFSHRKVALNPAASFSRRWVSRFVERSRI